MWTTSGKPHGLFEIRGDEVSLGAVVVILEKREHFREI